MIHSLTHLAQVTMKMEVGDALKLSAHEIRRISPDNWFTGESGIDRLKSNVVGAAFDWRFDENPLTGDLTLYRVESDGKRRHVDFDRRDHFEEAPDGTFVPWLRRNS